MFGVAAQKRSRDKIVDTSIKSSGPVSDCKIFLKSDGKRLNTASKSSEQRDSNPVTLKSRLLPYKSSLPLESIKRAELLLPYKSYEKKQNKKKFLKQLNVKVYDRYKNHNTGKIKKTRQIENDMNDVCAVTDFDENFFKIINGRQLFHCIPLYKSINTLLSSLLRIRQEVGYKNDCILNIETNFSVEKKIYDLSMQRFTEEAKTFDKYIMEDYQKSMKLIQEEENLNSKLDAKILELQNLAEESFTIMSRLIGLDYKYSLQQKYGRFLYYLAPPIWRSNNREFARSVEIEAKGFDFGDTNVDDTFTVMFEKMRNECLSSLVKPVLYFTHPHDLMDVLTGIEKQQLYHFSRETQLAPHKKSLKESLRILKEKNALDSAAVKASITGFTNLLSFCEERSTQLKEQFLKVLNGCFYESVGTPEVLKLFLHLEFCFEKVFNEKPISMDIVAMAKAIEAIYLDYSKRLDAIQGHTVRKAMKKCMDMDIRKIVRAKDAAKELRLFHRLEKELLIACNLLPQEMNVQISKKEKIQMKCNRSRSGVCDEPQQSLTEAEVEYLTLFTDWTESENPAFYLKSLDTDNMM